MVHREVLPTPSLGPGQGVWTSYGSSIIKAPAREVYDAVLDLHSYPKWNLYTTTIDTPSSTNSISVGDNITVHYRPESTGSTIAVPCDVSTISDEDLSVSWVGRPPYVPAWMLFPEKVQRVTPKGEWECLYEVWETQSGPMAFLIKWSMGAKASATNQGIADGLKKYVEDQQ